MKVSVAHFIRLAFLLQALALTSCISEEESGYGSKLKAGDMLPAFSVRLDGGEVFDSSKQAGKVSVIVFFNMLCPDCRQELPEVNRLYQDYGDDERVSFACLGRDETDESIRAYWEEHGLSMPYHADEGRKVYGLFAESTVPLIYISDGNLVIRYVYTDSPLASYDEMKEAVASLLDIVPD